MGARPYIVGSSSGWGGAGSSEEKSQRRIVDHRLMVAQDILPDDSADGVTPPSSSAFGWCWSYQSRICHRSGLAALRESTEHRPACKRCPMPGLPGVAHGNSFGSTIAQFNEGLGRPGVEHDVDWPAVEVSDELQVSNLGP